MVPIVEEDLEVHVGNIGARGPNCGETGSETMNLSIRYFHNQRM